MVKVSVIVPVKDDKRLIDLIKALEKQTFKDFEVLIADDSEKRIFNGKTTLNLKYFHVKPMKIAEKLHFLAEKSNSNLIAITESDCVPSE
ncbi:MAG: glycosyltransferase family 2 protein, partial [Candidatus Aenigmarchaeota archaeon]|nr:glycosyltransferase family 2 protein [Candidatus Aenigmarchaeota archaeon]